jgi:hypothetical protein
MKLRIFFLTVLLVLVASTNAWAKLPNMVDVFQDASQKAPLTVKLADLPVLTDEYNVRLQGKTKSVAVSFTGVPLIDLLRAAGANIENVNFVKVRYGTTDDSRISLVALNQSRAVRPPMILGSGKRPGLGPFRTPAVIPGQPDFTKAINESSFTPFPLESSRLALVPGTPGAKILRVAMRAARRKTGEYLIRPIYTNGERGAVRSYSWFGYDSAGTPFNLGSSKDLTTRNATRGSATHSVSVVIYEFGTGSTGVGRFSYISRTKSK